MIINHPKIKQNPFKNYKRRTTPISYSPIPPIILTPKSPVKLLKSLLNYSLSIPFLPPPPLPFLPLTPILPLLINIHKGDDDPTQLKVSHPLEKGLLIKVTSAQTYPFEGVLEATGRDATEEGFDGPEGE